MEEVWAGKDEYYAQRRADESTMDPEYYRSYAENVFTDINEEFFNRMYQFHYISGYPDGTFRPEEPVSRQMRPFCCGRRCICTGWTILPTCLNRRCRSEIVSAITIRWEAGQALLSIISSYSDASTEYQRTVLLRRS